MITQNLAYMYVGIIIITQKAVIALTTHPDEWAEPIIILYKDERTQSKMVGSTLYSHCV